jgi:hypothetical protein
MFIGLSFIAGHILNVDGGRSKAVIERWLTLSEHRFAFYKWKLCRVGL